MAREKGPMWDFFWEGPKSNGCHARAYCLGCIRNKMSRSQLSDEDTKKIDNEQAFKQACSNTTSVLREKKAMIAHILRGKKGCQHASQEAVRKAQELRDGLKGKKRDKEEDSDNDEAKDNDMMASASSKRRKIVDRVQTHQTKLKVFKGIDIPFTEEQKKSIQAQFLCASVSAKLPSLWVEDPEIIKLFLMFRSAAGDVIPSRKVLSERLLHEEYERVEAELKEELEGRSVTLTCDGVKDISKNSLMGVNVSAGFKPHMVDLYDATEGGKDGNAMCIAFEKMIDKTEREYKCEVVALGTDNDGGSRAGHVKLGKLRPWVFEFPCVTHQGQLVLGDYFKACPEAAETSEDSTDLVGWINNHGKVQKIFDRTQKEKTGKSLMYIAGNLTRWTTHEASFKRLDEVNVPLRSASMEKHLQIIEAEVGAEKNFREVQRLRTDAEAHCDLIDDFSFWQRLRRIIEDIEPISYATNICQSDHARLDVVLLAFVGIFLHFRNLPSSRSQVSKEMVT
ncbi:hypothetical protein VKT23_016720 [Stygiomarasmius scandens]|uniref:DUF659 domain-containing protein n=1 Tax=Marasmiellus scandens TaxID=2682957 RepID=A0ABR1IW85_9AGAR